MKSSRSMGMRWATLLAVAAVVTGLAGSSGAAPMVQNLFPTGFGYTSGSVNPNSQDAQWKVAAWAAGGTFQSSYYTGTGQVPYDYTPSGTTPYDAYVFQSNVPSPQGIPNQWLMGNSNLGFAGGLWIGLQNSPLGIINSPTTAFPGDFRSSMVLSTTFESTGTGSALLDFWAAADNVVAFFVGGTVTTTTNAVVGDTVIGLDPGWQTTSTGSNFPTIAGGQQIGLGRGFGRLTHYSAYANVVAGTNTLYAVVYDSVAGTDNWTGFLLTPVPEPSSVVLAGIAVGCIAYSHHRSLRRRRLRSAGSGPAVDGSPTAGG